MTKQDHGGWGKLFVGDHLCSKSQAGIVTPFELISLQ